MTQQTAKAPATAPGKDFPAPGAKTSADKTPAAKSLATARVSGEFLSLPIGRLYASKLNPRRQFDKDAGDDLAVSIVAKGILQPLLVRPGEADKTGGRYEVIAGERRLRAANLAVGDNRLPKDFRVPVIVHTCSDAELVLLAATENMQRKDMHPLEEAAVFQALIDQGYVAEEIYKSLGVPVRTVSRRLALLRCAPEVQKEFRAGKLNQQQAEAMAIGDIDSQKKILREVLRDGNRDPDAIRQHFQEEMTTVNQVNFNLDLYKGEYVDDEDDEILYFADQKLAEKLQAQWLNEQLAALKKEFPWAETVAHGHRDYYSDWMKAPAKDKDAGAIIYIAHNGKAEIKRNVWRPEIAEQKRKAERVREAISSRSSSKAGSKPKTDARALTNGQVNETKRAKTQAMRRGLIDTPKAALVLAILGIDGSDEIGVSADELGRDQFRSIGGEEFQFKTLPADVARQKERLAVLNVGKIEEGDQFKALMKLEIAQLLQILAALMCPLIGSHAINGGFGLAPHDSPLAVAIAEAVGADKHLAAYWKPDAEYFEQYPSRTRLMTLAVEALNNRKAVDKLKKGEIVTMLVKAPAGTWVPGRFPEMSFTADAKAIPKAFAAGAKRAEPKFTSYVGSPENGPKPLAADKGVKVLKMAAAKQKTSPKKAKASRPHKSAPKKKAA